MPYMLHLRLIFRRLLKYLSATILRLSKKVLPISKNKLTVHNIDRTLVLHGLNLPILCIYEIYIEIKVNFNFYFHTPF